MLDQTNGPIRGEEGACSLELPDNPKKDSELRLSGAVPSSMDVRDATTLIETAVLHPGGTWADLGAGAGTFTLALARLLGRTGRVFAVERDGHALNQLRRMASRRTDGVAPISTIEADFSQRLELPILDGALLANALHFVADARQPEVLARLARAIRPGGRIVVVEYEGRRPSRWVPYPVALARLGAIARDADLAQPEPAGSRASAFGGRMYVATITLPVIVDAISRPGEYQENRSSSR